ncbi:MAG: glycosyltransferase [Pseudomonadales bacterium]|nr:glycosyltransferase [Pseudomonadales bacterium]
MVASNVVDHPLFFNDRINGLLLDNNPEKWTNACDLLLDDVEQRASIAAAGYADLLRRLTSDFAAEQLEKVLLRAISKQSAN